MIRKLAIVLAAAIAGAPVQAEATNTFAQQFGLSCERCHSVMPMLNTFGENFRSNGYRVAGMRPIRMIPLASSVLVTLRNTGESKPQTMLEEWRLQSAGALVPSATYYLEQYLVDGGSPGSLDQAWVQLDSNTAHPTAKVGLRVRAGKLYLPLPVYADTYRPTLSPYAIFEQDVGNNDFTLNGPHTGIDFSAGDAYLGTALHLFSGSDNAGAFATQRLGPIDFSVYRVVGSATVGSASAAAGSANDRFWRQGLGAVVRSRSIQWSAVLQHGYDGNADGLGLALSSSGGFTEMQWLMNDKTMAALRFDQTSQAASTSRSVTAALLFALSRDSRLTIENSVHDGKYDLREAVFFAF